VLNISAIPDGFFAKYSLSESQSDQSSSQHNTSWQVNLAVTASLGLTLGNCEFSPDCFNNTTTIATNDTWGGTVKDQTSYGSAETFNAAFSSQFGDYLRFEESRVNLYIYPVIGKTACPDTAECPDSDKAPMFMQFSAPERASHANVLGTSLEWYQPPWEPGNILSYPGNEEQLMAYLPDLQKLSGEDESFQTDRTPGTESTTWSSSGGASHTAGTSTNFNGSFSNSTTAKGGLFGFNVRLNLMVSVSGGQAAENLTTSQTTLGSSSGIEVAKPGTFLDPGNYRYAYTPIIHGHKKPNAVVNDQSVPGDIQTFGFLSASYLVDPLSTRAGFWIDNYNAHPDVALNHPIRWQVNSTTVNPNDGTCLPINTTTPRWDCVTPGTKFSPR
jgi:hypothetical protein